jgi:hypothetical protein
MRGTEKGAGLGRPVAMRRDAGGVDGRVIVGSNEWRVRDWSRETLERTERSTTICETFVTQQQEEEVRVRQCPSAPAVPGVGTVDRVGRAFGGVASEWQHWCFDGSGAGKDSQ